MKPAGAQKGMIVSHGHADMTKRLHRADGNALSDPGVAIR